MSTVSIVVAKHIFDFLCRNDGSSSFGAVESDLQRRFTVADDILSQALGNQQKFLIVQDGIGSLKPAPNSLIVAKTSLRVCKDNNCPGCEELHLCKYFVCGNCNFGVKCKNSHDLTSAHNIDLLKKNDLISLSSGQLFQLLLQNDPSLLPDVSINSKKPVCTHYNKGNGDYGSCKHKSSCINLHLCLHFLQEQCKFGATCKRAHSFDANALKILKKRGVSEENERQILKLYRNRLLITSPAFRKAETVAVPAPKGATRKKSSGSVSEADLNEICLYFIRTGCSFKDKCVRVHHHLPYKWQILQKDGSTWSDLGNEEEIENAYSSPANSLCITEVNSQTLVVDFTSMTCGGSEVRRLSTASSVTKPPNFILTTEWVWYWRNDMGGWTEYGKGEDTKYVASVTSDQLENLYQADSETEIPFSSKSHQYILNFNKMTQQNQIHKTVRDVRRRPRFVSSQDVKSKTNGSQSPDSSASVSAEVPSYWDKSSLGSSPYKTIALPETSKEYQRVSKMFSKTLSKKIHSIERVQNLSLWKVFEWQKEQMKLRNGGIDVEERYLFHGTDESLVTAICDQNFDWRMCGSHGTLYGKGSYFARDSSYSDRYAKSRNGKTKKMFLALVLVGDFTRGNSVLVRPPQKPHSNKFYDSCVDSENNPAIFVVFEKYQIYPEYIIEYS
ncbi:hypothetical protein DNTS_022058 [Danionella cerebrum]|uniref:Poly [ADP-ribose] polymerase n=1 Tax=Danionella cerebrum TaxID=2873325 RepID=A0A553PYV0_9TELE|nr:hypothetical protein DNTS_022058 [Danionella translucida]